MNYFSDFWNRLLDATTGSLKTSIVDGSGSQITSFGGGTQYTEADTDASITGTALLWEDTSDTLRAASAAKPLPVDVKSVAPGTYAVDDSAMPATPQTVPVSGEYRSSATTYTDGDVTVLQTDVNGNLKVTQATAQSATVDTITAKLATDTIQNGTTALTPKFAIIDAASSGDNTLLAAVASKKIRVLSLYLVSAGTVNVRFESGAGGTALSGQMNLVVNTGFVLPFNPIGWFETASNTLLNLELSAAVSVDGGFTYVEV